MNERAGTRTLSVTAALGLGGMVAAGLFVSWQRFWINWLVWFLFILMIGLGCLFLVALEHLVGAKWSVPLRRVPEKLSGLALLMGPAALLALLSLPELYPWTKTESLMDPVIAGKAVWLNIPFFAARVVTCLGLWYLAYRIFVSGSLRQDRDRDCGFNVRARRFAPVYMIIFGITITIVAFDWISSLEPAWYSDVFGIYIFAGTFLAGLAATILAILYLQARGKLAGVRSDHIYNLGGFVFAFVVFWSYIGFAQYLLMWYANLPEEVFWYQARLEGPWGALLLTLALFHFLLPFLVLIPRSAKSEPKRLLWIAALMLLAHWLDLYWMIFPTLRQGVLCSWPEISFGLFFVSVSLLWTRQTLMHGEEMPVGDPFLREGLEFRL